MSPSLLEDAFQRRFSYLRLSVTDACSFRCGYCLPTGYKKQPDSPTFLSQTEIENLVTAFAQLGVWKIRLTGGEPTDRADLLSIARRIREIPGVTKMALSTNGHRLPSLLKDLLEAGVSHLNISIDTLDPERFSSVTGVKALPKILGAVDKAIALGFFVKVNAVLLKGINDGEFESFLQFVKQRPVSLRWIELMPTDQGAEYFKKHHLKSDALRSALRSSGWSPRERAEGDGPAVEYLHPDFTGRVGVIAPYAKDFCSTCNRLRVTAHGALQLCLFGESNSTLRPLLQSPDQREELKAHIQFLLQKKEVSHFLPEGRHGNNATFSAIGG